MDVGSRRLLGLCLFFFFFLTSQENLVQKEVKRQEPVQAGEG